MKTVIMAGGKGSRIAELFPEIPKPLIPLTGPEGETRPVLEWEIMSLRDQGFTDIILTVGYKAEQIRAYFGDGSRIGANITYYVEDSPLGNAGALFKLGLTEDFLLLNADTVFEIDFNRFTDFHFSKGGLATLLTHPNNHPYDSGLIIAGEDGSADRWLTKEEPRPAYYRNRVNAGLHVIHPKALAKSGIDAARIGTEGPDGKTIKADLDRQILKPLCGTGQMFCYDSPEYVRDMGTPERFRAVAEDFRTGKVQAKSRKHKQKAIFLDRDGTINRYVGFLRRAEEMELLPGAAEAIRQINRSGYLAIVITNQPVIARGETTEAELREIHNKMETLLGNEGAYIDGLYYCPHHPDSGFEGEIRELKIPCECRKPKPGMLRRAAEDFNIDLGASWMIGDGKNDILAGKAAGCRTILTGEGDYGQDETAGSLQEAAGIILQ